jgi:murein DD-endopeptidase MepM/ murein hydrolase activator NlpD
LWYEYAVKKIGQKRVNKKLNSLREWPLFFKITAVVLLLCTSLMVYEYVRLYRTAQELAVLKEDYRTYVMGLRRMLRDKAKNDVGEPYGDVKKNAIAEHVCSYSGAYRACSNHPTDSFCVVNRDPEYLKLHALHYTREKIVTEKRPHTIVKSSKRMARRKKEKKVSRFGSLTGAASRALPLPDNQDNKPWERDFSFGWPIDRSQFWLSSRFGPRNMGKLGWRFHAGIDMAANKGTPVHASASGIVIQSGWLGGYGKCIVIMHNKKYKTRYAHLSKRYVDVGEKVERGELIGAVGDTGFVRKKGTDASHLHFEVYSFGRHINPLSVLI